MPHEPRLKFPFLLSATLFYGMEYTLDTINGNFIVRMTDEQKFERNFKLKELRGKLYPQIDGILIQDVDSFLRDWYIFWKVTFNKIFCIVQVSAWTFFFCKKYIEIFLGAQTRINGVNAEIGEARKDAALAPQEKLINLPNEKLIFITR